MVPPELEAVWLGDAGADKRLVRLQAAFSVRGNGEEQQNALLLAAKSAFCVTNTVCECVA